MKTLPLLLALALSGAIPGRAQARAPQPGCLADRYGNVVCSSVPRGAAALDIHGEAVCAEGCVKATAAACIVPST